MYNLADANEVKAKIKVEKAAAASFPSTVVAG
jgi:hypothetical protein